MTPANLPDYDRRPYWHATMPAIPSFALGTAFGMRMARRLGRVPAAYRGRPWFLPVAGEWFRFADWWARRGAASTAVREADLSVTRGAGS
ncbi:hypothetical protein BH24CHL8_BH24CHL8_06960 [soil metagenome]